MANGGCCTAMATGWKHNTRRPPSLPNEPLQAARKAAIGRIVSQRIAAGGYHAVDLLRRQPEAGRNGLEFGGAGRVELVEADTADEQLQVVAIPAGPRAIFGAVGG